MQKLLYCLVFTIFSQIGFSQQNRFIYIQTENKQPFYVKLDKKVFSSASSGYVIIPKLIDGTYKLSIGFPKNEWAVQNIQYTVNQKDAGYLLKNFGDKGWGLFNLQTLDVLMATSSSQTNNVVVTKEIKTDSFSNMLSEVVKDPSIKESEVIAEPIKAIVKEEVAKVPPPIVPEPQSIQSKITRTLYNTNADGTEMIYIDESGNQKDTIIIFIPADKTVAASIPQKKEAEEPKQEIKVDEVTTKVEPATSPKFIKEIEITAPAKGQEATTTPTTTPIINTNCKNVATTDDLIKLRKKMVADNSDDDMIETAKKAFKTKCFATEQIKSLSAFFLKDSSKYAFFDAAYPYVSDVQQFKTLQSLLTEEYYINRFKAMIY